MSNYGMNEGMDDFKWNSTDGQYCASGQYYAKIKTLAFAAQTSYFSIFFSPKTPTFPPERCTSTDTFLPKNIIGVLYIIKEKRKVVPLQFVSLVL